MELICDSCERRDMPSGCLPCRLKQFDTAVEIYVTDGLTEAAAVERTEEVINNGMKDITDKYDSKNEMNGNT